MKLTQILTIISIIGLLGLGACSSSSSSTNQNGASVSLGSPFIGGDEAMNFGFQNQFPPESIRDNAQQRFNIQFELENIGEYDIPAESSYVRLKGIDKESFGISEDSVVLPELRGVSTVSGNSIPGGKHIAMFTNLAYSKELISGSTPMTIHANLCYPYGTKVVSKLCVSGNTYGTEEENDICSITNEAVEVKNSASPVKIQNVKQYPAGPNSVQLMFDIVHTPTSSDGQIFESGSYDNRCEIEDIYSKKNRVTYSIDTGIAGINCEGTGSGTNTVTLSDVGSYTVICTQDTTGQENYEKLISMELDFGYMEKISKTVEIIHN